jgi:hypothetical protein
MATILPKLHSLLNVTPWETKMKVKKTVKPSYLGVPFKYAGETEIVDKTYMERVIKATRWGFKDMQEVDPVTKNELCPLGRTRPFGCVVWYEDFAYDRQTRNLLRDLRIAGGVMTDTIRILCAITRAPIDVPTVIKALGGEKPPGLLDTMEALERFELVKINRLQPGCHETLTVYLTDLGAERAIEAILGAGQELPPGLIKPEKVRRPRGRVPKQSLFTKSQPPTEGKSWHRRKGVDWNIEQP